MSIKHVYQQISCKRYDWIIILIHPGPSHMVFVPFPGTMGNVYQGGPESWSRIHQDSTSPVTILVLVPAVVFLWFSNSTLMFLCGSGLGGRGQRKPGHSGDFRGWDGVLLCGQGQGESPRCSRWALVPRSSDAGSSPVSLELPSPSRSAAVVRANRPSKRAPSRRRCVASVRSWWC